MPSEPEETANGQVNGETENDLEKEQGENGNRLEGQGGMEEEEDRGGVNDNGDKSGNELEIDEDDSMDDFEMGGFIRIRSQDDGIFEQDEDDFEFEDYHIPEVEIQLPQVSRKRKQELNVIENDSGEIIEVNDEEEDDSFMREPTYTVDPELFTARRRDRMPLYLLNPDDYAHDPKKQVQIRRAIITYRHHQDKKEQIIKLTDENKKLRSHIEDLKAKMVELSQCGCEKNKGVSLDELFVKIPVVPPRMYVRGNRPVLAVPYNRCSLPPTRFNSTSCQKVKAEGDVKTSPPSVSSANSNPVVRPGHPKPLINIGTNRLIQLNALGKFNAISRANTGSIQYQSSQVTRLAANGRPAVVSISQASGLLPTGTVVKMEPGAELNAGTTIPMTAAVKVEGGNTPATASPVSRLVFAKRGAVSSSSPSVPTASQLLFANRTSSSNVPLNRVGLTQTASQLGFHNRLQSVSASQLSHLSATSSQPLKVLRPNSTQVFRTPSGQVLKLVQPPALYPKPCSTSTVSVSKKPISTFQPILPKSTPGQVQAGPSEAFRKPLEKKEVEDLWKRFDDDDDDEMAIIAAISGTAPPRNRKQTMDLRKAPSPQRYREEIQLNRYEDIVFEEAD